MILYAILQQWNVTNLFTYWFPCFNGNINQLDKTDNKYDRLLKFRTVFDQFIDAYAKFNNPSEQLTVDEVMVFFKGKVIFKQCTAFLFLSSIKMGDPLQSHIFLPSLHWTFDWCLSSWLLFWDYSCIHSFHVFVTFPLIILYIVSSCQCTPKKQTLV
jgi:hypothetical protein